MHKHAATAIEPFLDETVGGWKVLYQILVLDVIHLDDVLLERAEQVVV